MSGESGTEITNIIFNYEQICGFCIFLKVLY